MTANILKAADGSNIPVLLLKTKSTPNDGYLERFSADGTFDPIFVPVLEHQFMEEGMNVFRDGLRERIFRKDESARYGGLIFTSQRAVEAFAKLVDEGRGL